MKQVSRQSRVEAVCAVLSGEIQALGDQPGQMLPTTQALSERFGVSRTVMREAISRLASQGLVEVRHGVGLRVAHKLHRPVTASMALVVPERAERLRQAMAARLLLETEIARLATPAMDAAGVAALRQAQRELRAATTTDDAIGADLRFHQVLAAHCGNEVLALLLDSIVELGRASRQMTLARTGQATAHRQHAAILAAILAGDAGRAAAAMHAHLLAARADLEAQLSSTEESPP